MKLVNRRLVPASLMALCVIAATQNAWGVAFTPAASPFWIADNAT
jgi:hypothetical protein